MSTLHRKEGEENKKLEIHGYSINIKLIIQKTYIVNRNGEIFGSIIGELVYLISVDG